MVFAQTYGFEYALREIMLLTQQAIRRYAGWQIPVTCGGPQMNEREDVCITAAPALLFY